MSPSGTDPKEANEIEAAYSHEEEHADDETSLQLNSRLRWKLDLFILPVISMVYFFAQMVGPKCHSLRITFKLDTSRTYIGQIRPRQCRSRWTFG